MPDVLRRRGPGGGVGQPEVLLQQVPRGPRLQLLALVLRPLHRLPRQLLHRRRARVLHPEVEEVQAAGKVI